MVLEVQAGHSYEPKLELDAENNITGFKLVDAGTSYDQNCFVGEYPDKSGVRKRATGCL
jgi:hypothetical protein